MNQFNKLIMEMIKYNKGDAKRIQHFTKVHFFAKMIGELEELSEEEQNILEVSAIVHDIGIKVCEEKYGNCSGKHQEEEGPAIAETLLVKLRYSPKIIERVAYLVGHHHTYQNIQGKDYQILVEADFLVNMYEDSMGKKEIEKVYKTIFQTDTGKKICLEMFLPEK